MRATTTTTGLLISLIVCSVCSVSLAGDERPVAGADLIPVAIGYQTTLHSSVLGEDRDILIALPDDYLSSDHAYPVIYLLDGRFNFQHTASTVGLLGRLGHIPRMIVVAIANVDRHRDFTAIVNPNTKLGGGAEPFLDFIEQELVPYVDKRFRTRPYRIIIGHSLGGLLALHAMVSRPDLFNAFLTISPAITSDEQKVKGQPLPLTTRTEQLLELYQSLPKFVYMTMSDTEHADWVDDLKRFGRVLDKHAPSDFVWQYHDMPPGEDHTTSVLKATYDGLRAAFSDWNPPSLARANLRQLEKHYQNLSQRLGYQVALPEAVVNNLGYRYLQQNRIELALNAFEHNLRAYSESANVYDSLGDALAAAGRHQEALESYQKAYRIGLETSNPNLSYFKTNIDRMEALVRTSPSRIEATALQPPGNRR